MFILQHVLNSSSNTASDGHININKGRSNSDHTSNFNRSRKKKDHDYKTSKIILCWIMYCLMKVVHFLKKEFCLE